MTGRMLAVIAFVLAAPGLCFAQSADEVTKVKTEIWAKELAIYAGRAKGSTAYYYNNSSVDFLAWVYGTPKPFRRATFPPSGQMGTAMNHEKIENTLSDFSLHGDTAIIYYVNHRTMMLNGDPVDQMFDNIHVWVRENGDWKVLASMSRLDPPAPPPATAH